MFRNVFVPTMARFIAKIINKTLKTTCRPSAPMVPVPAVILTLVIVVITNAEMVAMYINAIGK